MDRADAFGPLLRRHRRGAGLTQDALAEQAGHSTVYIGVREHGLPVPTTATARLLAEALALGPPDRGRLEVAREIFCRLGAGDDAERAAREGWARQV